MSSTRVRSSAHRYSAPKLRLLGAALFWLGVARICVTLLPFRHTVRLLGLRPGESSAALAETDLDSASRIAWAIAAGAARAPWSSTCMVQALAASVLLHRAGIARTLHLGVARDPASGDGFAAHAWVSVGAEVVVGQAERRHYTAVGSFS